MKRNRNASRKSGRPQAGTRGTSRRTRQVGAPPGPKRSAEGDVRQANVRVTHAYGSGFDDKLRPTTPLDLGKIDSISDLVAAYERAAIGARAVGEAAEILLEMTRDPKVFVVCTVSGAMTVAKMGLVLCDMIEQGMVHAVVATGALVAHGFVESSGKLHFKYDPTMTDDELFERGYNRVFDSIELERNLDHVEHVFRQVISKTTNVDEWSSHTITHALGRYLHERDMGRGILRSAYENGVPVYIPAFTDSELGLDFAIHRLRCLQDKVPMPRYDPFLDLQDYRERVMRSAKLGIFTIGGGVPRNWAQQIGPYLDLLEKRAGIGDGLRRFEYGVRICPEPTHWGGLSGCTYSEGVSWGKFLPIVEGGRYAEVYSDATIVWPLVVKAVLERLGSRPTGGRRVKARRARTSRATA